MIYKQKFRAGLNRPPDKRGRKQSRHREISLCGMNLNEIWRNTEGKMTDRMKQKRKKRIKE